MRPVLVFRVTITRLHMLCRSAFRSDGFTAPTLGPKDWHDSQMSTLARMIGQGRSWWYTTAFWLVFVVCLYLALLMADWWWLILVGLIGVTINYCWWSVERVQRSFVWSSRRYSVDRPWWSWRLPVGSSYTRSPCPSTASATDEQSAARC